MLFLSYLQPYFNGVHLLVKDPKVTIFWEDWGIESFEEAWMIQEFTTWKDLESNLSESQLENWDYFWDLDHSSDIDFIYAVVDFEIYDDLRNRLTKQDEEHELQIQQLNAKFDLEREDWQKAFAALKQDLGV